KGFTLIEVIVVAVIVAVLAAVAIPLYNGYIHDTRQDVVDNLAQTAAAAANAYWRKTGAMPTPDQLKLFYDKSTYKIDIDGTNVIVTHKTKTSITQTVPYTN
ncbi:MAG: prepilin-type N-terminal cleavage/methylation domain-containing protein, partial [Fibrobacterota bacterium]